LGKVGLLGRMEAQEPQLWVLLVLLEYRVRERRAVVAAPRELPRALVRVKALRLLQQSVVQVHLGTEV